MKKNCNNNSKKGFTLVELVVVLVILAILSAMLMPSLSGYIDKAKEKRVVAEVHQVVVAAQTLADEAYARQDEPDYDTLVSLEKVKDLADIKGEIESIAIERESGKVTYVAVTRSGITGYFEESLDIILTDNDEDIPECPDDEDDYAIICEGGEDDEEPPTQ